MLLIHKSLSKKKKLLTLGIASTCSIGALLGLSALTYTPELSHADTVIGSHGENPTTTLSNATYMQELTAGMCDRSVENESKQLIDTRDGKKYWVAKLKDENCWMTQNLDLDLWDNENNVGVKLTSQDSDLPDGTAWISTTGVSSVWTSGDENYYIVKYYDPGLLFCEGGLYCRKNTNFSAEDLHYMSGNYYSWLAAVANGDEELKNDTVVQQSICPKGWKLPVHGNNLMSQPGSYYTLVSKYGLANSVFDETTQYGLLQAPLFFATSGHVFNNRLNDTRHFFLWTSTVASAKSSAYVYYADFSASQILYTHHPMWYGFSVRCVLSDGDGDYTSNVTARVNHQISIDISNKVIIEKSSTNPSTANLDVKVSSNQPYSVNINAKDHAELTSNTTEVKIPSASGTLSGSSNEWGIKKPEETEYTAVATTPQLFYQSSVAEIKTTPFIIGISTSPDIPNGEYSTDITITATQN